MRAYIQRIFFAHSGATDTLAPSSFDTTTGITNAL
jgi:hypothetical protein